MGFTNKHLDKKYPIKEWIRIYTDGSATDAVINGGGGVYATLPDGTTLERSFACGMQCTNYKAETGDIKEKRNHQRGFLIEDEEDFLHYERLNRLHLLSIDCGGINDICDDDDDDDDESNDHRDDDINGSLKMIRVVISLISSMIAFLLLVMLVFKLISR
ncbi:hypothetical protein ElyMa_005194100 [Elysia marginata]|uniref:RNase H type-1 domain-containing protein n=1 Tax=Elysia marginata TaxID=1093978 RepID=A0AAV4JV28_9GAST|nr:hypothetical protein ElyMa_005194100 [Elysia marginata]